MISWVCFLSYCFNGYTLFFFSFDAVNIGNVRAKVYSFGNSLKKGGFVSSPVMCVFCRVMFHDNHPSKSKRNYFFPSIGVSYMFSFIAFSIF